MFEYPALYRMADSFSNQSQITYFWLIGGEYILLFLTAVLSVEFMKNSLYFCIYASIFLAALVLLLIRSWMKPEQSWYKGRALSESIKTSCWRYCMRAEPFGSSDNDVVTRAEFRNHLSGILSASRHIGDRLPESFAADEQITRTMNDVRALSLDLRKNYYDEYRVKDQREWYARKAGLNKKSSRRWIFLGIMAYAVAIVLIILRVGYPESNIWPIEPLIVVASSIIGWTQIKKFNELATSYTLTAHEIGIIRGRISDIRTDAEFSSFVNEAEQAFSREHTQWVARQQSQ